MSTRLVVALLPAVLCAIFIVACGTVVPVSPVSNIPSPDGNEFNSGLIGFLPGGSAVVSAHWRDRYNSMIAKYGAALNLRPDEGVVAFTNGTFLVDRQHHECFAIMNHWRKQQ